MNELMTSSSSLVTLIQGLCNNQCVMISFLENDSCVINDKMVDSWLNLSTIPIGHLGFCGSKNTLVDIKMSSNCTVIMK